MDKKTVIVVNEDIKEKFESICNELIDKGYRIDSSNSSWSEIYETHSFQAIMIKYPNKSA